MTELPTCPTGRVVYTTDVEAQIDAEVIREAADPGTRKKLTRSERCGVCLLWHVIYPTKNTWKAMLKQVKKIESGRPPSRKGKKALRAMRCLQEESE